LEEDQNQELADISRQSTNESWLTCSCTFTFSQQNVQKGPK